MATAAYNARVIASGAAVAMTDEAMSDSGDGLTFTLDDATKNIFDPDATFVVEVDSGGGFAAAATSSYSIDYLLGEVTFNSSQTGNSVQITGSYLPKFTLAQGRSATFDVTVNLADSSVLGDQGERREPLRQDVAITIDQLAVGDVPLDGSSGTENTILDILRDADEIVLEIQPDRASATELLRAFVRIESEGISIPNNDLVLGSISAVGSWRTPAMSSQSGQIWSYGT